jgi:hypothetical protein
MIVYRSVSRDVRPFISRVSFIINCFTDFSVQCNRSQRSCTPSGSIATGCANLAPQEDVQEDWGWKLVHGEVFRTPNNPLVLAALVGNGAQLCSMVGITLGASRKLPRPISDAHAIVTQSLPCWASFLLQIGVLSPQ